MDMSAGMGAGMGAGMDAAAGMGAAGIVTVLKYVLVTLGGGILLGLVFGLVFAGIKYPNPNKRALFSPLQKIIVIVVAIIGITMIIYAFTKKPGSDVPAGADTSMGQMVDENGVPIATPDASGAGGTASGAGGTGDEGDGANADSDESAEGDSVASDGDSSEEGSEASSSSSSSSTPPATSNAPAAAQASPRVSFKGATRGGMVIMG